MHKFNIAMKFEEAIQKIQYGKCLLLTGAGFSLGAKNYKQDKSAFRIAKYIAHELYNECDVPKENQDDDLRRASQWYIRQYGEDKIIAFLQREFIIKEISPTQKELGNFPWRRCYTLNYDEILERAYLENNKLLSSVTLSDESEQYRTSSVCVHLNGVISQLSRATIDNSFKLTYKSYNKDYIKNTGWWEIFEDDLLLCDAIFFVGCSLQSDTDLIHLLDRTKNIKEKTFFIVGPDENDIDLMQLEDLGTPLKLGTEGFVRELQNVPIINVDIPYTFHHFVTPRITNQKPERKRISFIDLLVKGNVDENLLAYSIKNADSDFRLRLVDIVDDLGLDSLNNISFRINKFLREFIDFDTEEIVFKSSVLSNYILKNLLNYSDIDTPLIQIYERLHEKRSHKRIRKYLKEIMLYQNLNRILKKDSDQRGLNRAIFNIYEKVAYLEYNRENPLFWLQFAIARLADGEYSDAARCFDNAYSYAKNTNFDTFQIDNHFARYLLEDANEKKNVIEPIEVFKRAHRMLMASQKGNQYKHYSFRVARHYSTFYSIYHKDFSFHERYDFFIACHEMLDAVEKYLALPGASKKDMVEETRKQLEELLINEN